MKTIAITSNIENNKITVDRSFIDIVIKHGFLPIIVAPLSLKTVPEPKINFDALLLTDGEPITPVFYNEEPVPQLSKTDLHRDKFEMELVKKANTAGVPILGIGRGMQLLNVAFGGNLFQDIYAQNSGAGIQHYQPTPLTQPSHHIDITPESELFKAIGTHPYINSHHKQAIKNIAANFNIVATAPDGIIEAIESQDHTMQGIQWRPDKLDNLEQDKIFTRFFEKIN
ncbi:type 1 glutamine amidotransferase [Lactobacillus sp.]|uniref:gamma-glutamyl-gamma-aminobutyrate hydrolase family protein n=1 Tax=Lactobacillus sp. TaxID=1591 RepID=UPI0019C2FC99|nr:type 1 glutamine amidotransferase [Lactobacillus sp.]MBD5429604.1 type 1 glutamine amidotransferase [Lactobacillus sp.]